MKEFTKVNDWINFDIQRKALQKDDFYKALLILL